MTPKDKRANERSSDVLEGSEVDERPKHIFTEHASAKQLAKARPLSEPPDVEGDRTEASPAQGNGEIQGEAKGQSRWWTRRVLILSMLIPALMMVTEALLGRGWNASYFWGASLAWLYAWLSSLVVALMARTWPESGSLVLLLPLKTLLFLGIAWVIVSDPRIQVWPFSCALAGYPLAVLGASLWSLRSSS